MFLLKTAATTANSQLLRPAPSLPRPLSATRPTSYGHPPNPHRALHSSPPIAIPSAGENPRGQRLPG